MSLTNTSTQVLGPRDSQIAYVRNRLDSSEIPDPAFRSVLGSRRIFCGLVIDLGILKSVLNDVDWSQLYIFADTIVVPDDFALLIKNSGATFCARRIEAGRNAQLLIDRRGGIAGALVVYGAEILGDLQVGIASDSGNQTMAVAISPRGMGYAPPDLSTPLRALNGLTPQLFGTDMHLGQVLTTQFQLAALVFPEQPAVADSMLAWVARVAADVPNGQQDETFWNQLSVQALSLRSFVLAASGVATYVPPLDLKLYTAATAGLVAVAGTLEASYARVMDRAADLKLRQQEAQLMLDGGLDQAQYLTTLLRDARARYDAAMTARDAADSDYQAQALQVQLVQEDFKLAIREMQIDQTLKLVIDIAFTVVSVVALVASVVTTGIPAPGAAESTKKVVEGGEQLAERGAKAKETADRVKALADSLKKTSEMLDKLGKLAAAMRQLIDQSTQANKLPGKTAKLSAIDIDVSGVDDLSAAAEWDRMQIQVEAIMDGPIKAGIGKSMDLLAAFKILVVNGKALSANQQAVLRIADELLRLQMQLALADAQSVRLRGFIDSLKQGEATDVVLAQGLRGRLDDVKRSILLATLNYSWAYRYYALAESSVHPSLLKDVAGLQADLATAQTDFNNMLVNFLPTPPQPFERRIEITDPRALADLRETGFARFMLFHDDDTFSGMNRVRLTEMSVFLLGSTWPDQSSVRLTLSAAGMYRDRNRAQQYVFSGAPFSVTFEYRIDSSARGGMRITIPGMIADRFREFYFEPTPFTGWTVTLNTALRTRPELAKVNGLRLVFKGSALMS